MSEIGRSEMPSEAVLRLEKENAMLREKLAEKLSGHCKDCCCAQSWDALGITTYTGNSIPEEIRALRSELAAGAHVTARQTDLARKAEAECLELREKLVAAEDRTASDVGLIALESRRRMAAEARCAEMAAALRNQLGEAQDEIAGMRVYCGRLEEKLAGAEARCAAMVALLGDTHPLNLKTTDLAPWVHLIDTLRKAEDLSHGHDIDLESAGRYHFEEALGSVIDAARECGMGGET